LPSRKGTNLTHLCSVLPSGLLSSPCLK
jgi:hypothetical protein